MFIVTDADVEFLAPLGATYKLSAATFHPYGVPGNYQHTASG